MTGIRNSYYNPFTDENESISVIKEITEDKIVMLFLCNSFFNGDVPGLMTEEFYNDNIERLKKAETEALKGLCDIIFQKTTSEKFLFDVNIKNYEIGDPTFLENFDGEFYRNIFLSADTGKIFKLFYNSRISQREIRKQNLLFGIDGSTAVVFFAEATIHLNDKNPNVLWSFKPIQPTNEDYMVVEQYY